MDGGYDPSRKLALMHIPKSFGTSLTEGLSRAIKPGRAVSGFDGVLFGQFDAFHTLDIAARAAIHLSPDTLPDVDFIAGHFGCSTLRARYPCAQVVTVLREPVSRLLSLWLFWRAHLDTQLTEWGAWGDVVRLSRLDLATFLGDPRVACQTDNQAVRMLLWPHTLVPAGGFIDPAHDGVLLAEAMDRLERFDYVDVAEQGLTERLQAWLGRPFTLERRNETQSVPADLRIPLHTQLSPTAMTRLAECSRLDHRLWLSVAQSRLPLSDAARVAEQARLVNTARFAALMSE